MKDAILNFPKQFRFEPRIVNEDKLKECTKFIVVGMGGSHLCADILRCAYPEIDLLIRRNYGLPEVPDYFLNEALIVLSSFSGDTEEVLEAYEEAKTKGLSLAVIADRGELLERAERDSFPYIDLPNPGIEPRSAIGYSTLALAALLRHTDALQDLFKLKEIKPTEYEKEGRGLAEFLDKRTPIVYASSENYALAYNWKIKLNETGKIPAFYNVLPEANHNEMNGFMGKGDFSFIFLRDERDHPRIQKRMDILELLYEETGYPVLKSHVVGEHMFERIFGNLLVADWMSLSLAEKQGLDPASTPLISEFKARMKKGE